MLDIYGRQVLVVGAGRSGISAARLLKDKGARVTLSDGMASMSIRNLARLKDAGFIVERGSHGVLTFCRQNLIVVSPGIPLNIPEIVTARTGGVHIIGEIELAFNYLKGKMIAITGSNGKTTTSTLLAQILESNFGSTLLGGNIGPPLSDIVDLSTSDTWSVVEVSSFQLETTETFRPHIAIVLNITPDHLDRHHSFEAYADAKSYITRRQTEHDYLIVNRDDKTACMIASKTNARNYLFSSRGSVDQGVFVEDGHIVFKLFGTSEPEIVMSVTDIPIKGAHNIENILAAVCASRLAGVSSKVIRQAVSIFKAVEHRLESVCEINGVHYFNDSKATNVDATVKALEAFSGGIWLILGGKDKDSDYKVLSRLLRDRVKAVITIGSAAEKIECQLTGIVKIERAGTLERAVSYAFSNSIRGDIVLLAPACSSFDQFDNYEHRGRIFKELVKCLNEKVKDGEEGRSR